MSGAQLCGELGRLAVEGDGGPASGLTGDFNITPAHAMAPACAKSFHPRLFSSEPCSISLHPIGFGIAIADLSFGEYAVEEAVAMASQGLRDAGNLGDVDAGAD